MSSYLTSITVASPRGFIETALNTKNCAQPLRVSRTRTRSKDRIGTIPRQGTSQGGTSTFDFRVARWSAAESKARPPSRQWRNNIEKRGWKSRRARGRKNGTRRALRTWRSLANSVWFGGECTSCVLRFVSCITALIYGGRLPSLPLSHSLSPPPVFRNGPARATPFLFRSLSFRTCGYAEPHLSRVARFVSLDADEKLPS